MKVILIFSALLLVAFAQNVYLGCYQDDPDNRDLAILKVDDSDPPLPNSVDSCVFLCGKDEWPFAGLQGTDCYCGFVYGSLGKLADDECKSTCPGDDIAQYPYCGAVNKNAIYATGAQVIDTDDDDYTQPQPQPQAAGSSQSDADSLAANTQAALAALAAVSSQSSQSQSSQSQSSQSDSQSSQSQSSQSDSQSSQSQSSQQQAGSSNQDFFSQVQSQPLSAPVTQPQDDLPAADAFAVNSPDAEMSIPAVNEPIPMVNTPLPPVKPPATPVKPPATVPKVLCPICPYKRDECGGPTRGTCNRQTGNCQCINGWAGGACGGKNGKIGNAAYNAVGTPKAGTPPPQVKCPICPYKREECGGATRGTCNKQTAECVCKAPYTGGACSNRPGKVGAPGYNKPAPKPAGTPKQNPAPVTTPKPNPAPTTGTAKCPICPYKKAECGGPTRGTCNRQTGDCQCINGWSGGACAGKNGKTAAAVYNAATSKPGSPPPAIKCPICPNNKQECGGSSRGACNKQTGECGCKSGCTGGACSNGNPKSAGPAPKPTPKPAPKPTPKPAPKPNAKCPICPYKREECGGATRGSCNRQTGECACKSGYSGGACSNFGGKVGAAGYQTSGKAVPKGTPAPAVKCPICPYRRAECGGSDRGNCNRQTGQCNCINGWSGGACGGKNGKVGAAVYNRATQADSNTFAGNSASDSTSKMWVTSVGVLGAVVIVLFVVVIVLVVKLNAKDEERV